ncbi:MAG: exonuclease domain-containing protein [bacterium]|jgi:oligoribonuclease
MNASAGPYLVWFDTEYSTLELEQAHLLQVAMVITDMQGRRIAPAEKDLVTPVRLPLTASVSDFVAKECPDIVTQARSENAPTVSDVDHLLASTIDALVGPMVAKIKDRPILAGNTIHADWWFAQRYLPQFLTRLHYRMLDVSSLKILWLDAKLGPEFEKENITLMQDYLSGWILPKQAKRHDALYDVMCSIAELNFYRRHFIKTV